MRKVKVRTLYLIAIIVGGLVGLATKSTYAMFTASAEIDNPICMSANLTSEEETIETMEVVVTAGEKKTVPVTINNTSTNTVGYSVWYTSPSDKVKIGIKLSNSDSSNSTDTISSNGSKKVYVQIINNSSSSVTITLGVISNKTSNDMTLIPNTELDFSVNLVTYIKNLYTNTAKTTTTLDSVTYNLASSVGLMNDRKGSMSTGIDAGNIRYYGANPNNYIYFNCSDYSNQSSDTCETWRIIGVFDGKVKIMRGSQIGTYSWDNKNKDTGAETAYGKNDWNTARLMKLLNPSKYYEVDSNDNGNVQSLYWNAQSGTCFSGQNNATTSCDFTSTGLKNDTTRNMIAETTYYTRGHNSNRIFVDAMYDKERVSGTVYSGRSTSWTGKIAIPYPSDYGYAADLSQCQQQLYYYNDATCTANNWMKNIVTNNGGNVGWLLTPRSDSASIAWYVYSSGRVTGSYYASYAYGVAPVLSLSSELGIVAGTGTDSEPYQLSV